MFRGMRIIFATVIRTSAYQQVLTEMGVHNRLLSFYTLNDEGYSPEFIEHWVRTGLRPQARLPEAGGAAKWNYRVKNYLNWRILKLLDRQMFNEANPQEPSYWCLEE